MHKPLRLVKALRHELDDLLVVDEVIVKIRQFRKAGRRLDIFRIAGKLGNLPLAPVVHERQQLIAHRPDDEFPIGLPLEFGELHVQIVPSFKNRTEMMPPHGLDGPDADLPRQSVIIQDIVRADLHSDASSPGIPFNHRSAPGDDTVKSQRQKFFAVDERPRPPGIDKGQVSGAAKSLYGLSRAFRDSHVKIPKCAVNIKKYNLSAHKSSSSSKPSGASYGSFKRNAPFYASHESPYRIWSLRRSDNSFVPIGSFRISSSVMPVVLV